MVSARWTKQASGRAGIDVTLGSNMMARSASRPSTSTTNFSTGFLIFWVAKKGIVQRVLFLDVAWQNSGPNNANTQSHVRFSSACRVDEAPVRRGSGQAPGIKVVPAAHPQVSTKQRVARRSAHYNCRGRREGSIGTACSGVFFPILGGSSKQSRPSGRASVYGRRLLGAPAKASSSL